VRVLLDTNILTRSAEPADTDHPVAVDAVAILRTQGHELCLVPQNLYEYWAVSTRPAAQNGRGKSPDEVRLEFAFLKAHFTVLADNSRVLVEWENLVSTYKVIGKSSHDARLAAAMLSHGVAHILTFNDGDFRRYAGITPVLPERVHVPPGSAS
jgi:predicted nucleic acid-binding protein